MSSFSELFDIFLEDNLCIGLNMPSGRPTTYSDGTDDTVNRINRPHERIRKQTIIIPGESTPSVTSPSGVCMNLAKLAISLGKPPIWQTVPA